MASEMAPTKANLIKAKDALLFSRNGFALLDKKRTVLIREAMELLEKAEKLQSRVSDEFAEAYHFLQLANLTVGINNVRDAAASISSQENYTILYRSVMGLDVPVVRYDEEEEPKPSYSFVHTNSTLDRAVVKFNRIKFLIYQLAEVENAIYKISMEIKKTAKRANALEKIQIPRYMEMVKYIQEVIEEKEREDFFRLKKVKNHKREKDKEALKKQNCLRAVEAREG